MLTGLITILPVVLTLYLFYWQVGPRLPRSVSVDPSIISPPTPDIE